MEDLDLTIISNACKIDEFENYLDTREAEISEWLAEIKAEIRARMDNLINIRDDAEELLREVEEARDDKKPSEEQEEKIKQQERDCNILYNRINENIAWLDRIGQRL